jgi:hypothetical protein
MADEKNSDQSLRSHQAFWDGGIEFNYSCLGNSNLTYLRMNGRTLSQKSLHTYISGDQRTKRFGQGQAVNITACALAMQRKNGITRSESFAKEAEAEKSISKSF